MGGLKAAATSFCATNFPLSAGIGIAIALASRASCYLSVTTCDIAVTSGMFLRRPGNTWMGRSMAALRMAGLVAVGVAAALAVSGCGAALTPKPDSRIATAAPFMVVEIRPSGGPLAKQLAGAAQEAAASNLRPYVELTSSWCRACHWLDESVSTRSLAQAFGGTYLVRVDVDHWDAWLGGSGLDNHAGPLPAFVAISRRGLPIGDWVDRGAWGSDAPALAAPVLMDFFHWATP